MKNLLYILSFTLLLTGCGSSGNKNTSIPTTDNEDNSVPVAIDEDNTTTPTSYILHKNISTTIFWIGEEASEENGNIPNLTSAWDDTWMLNYGGIDSPDNRNNYYPKDFTPIENPFYFALPYNDFDNNGYKKSNLTTYIPWASNNDLPTLSICKNRWIKITKGTYIAYAQWEDVGPFGEDDREYVFGNSKPKNQINNNAGLDISPAVRDYLNLNDIDTVNWEFVNNNDVPEGPWKDIITKSNINWIEAWYKPKLNTNWQWQLEGNINENYNVVLYDIDLFESNISIIKSLHDKGKKVICYFSAGSYEEWRSDANDFAKESLGNNMDGWEDERWLDIRQQSIRDIMINRLNLAKEKRCDGVEPDNVDGYSNNTGFDLTSDDQIQYNKFLANEAHQRGLSIGLKNDLDQIEILEQFFDFAVNEQCHEYDECALLQPFVIHSKPVFNVEYADQYVNNTNEARDRLCNDANIENFRTLVLPLLLDDSFRYSCNN
jgi:endo-alpha-1,4-polygalactosaminidase (GH114 family)